MWGLVVNEISSSTIFIFLSVILAVPSYAGIYRYEDEKGVIHFTNCPRDSKFKLYIKESKEDVEGGTPFPFVIRKIQTASII